MPAMAFLPALRQHASSLWSDRRGVSAVEFGMVLPLLVTLYLGGIELSQAVNIERKVAITARAVADLVAQKRGANNIISTSEMEEILNAAKAVAAPYPADKLKVIVSSVKIDADKVAKVDWSTGYNTTANAAGMPVTLPPNLQTPNSSVIWSQVSYDYTPTIGYIITGTIPLKDYIYMRPRVYDVICYQKCTS